MINDFSSIIEKAQKVLSSLECEFSEVRLSSGITTGISLSGEEVESCSSGESIAGSVRILKNGLWSFVSFNNIRDVESFIKKGKNISNIISSEEKSGIIKYRAIKDKFGTECEIDLLDVSIDEKFELISKYNNILNSSSKIQTTRAGYRDVVSKYVYLNSEGSEILYDKSYTGISLSAIAKDGSIIQPFHNSISGYGGFEVVKDRDKIAEDVVKISIDLLKAESVSGGTYDVITDQKLSGVFIHEAFGHLSEADFVYENEQMKKQMILGKKFGPEELNVIDDGTIDKISGYIPFDDEGVIPEKTILIENGMLSGRLHSRETAYKMEEKVTGNGRALGVMRQPIVRMTNTYIANGSCSKEDIFDSVENGIYAIDVIGGQTNLEMFTFTSGYGFEIKNGKKGKMYKDIVLSGNVFKTLLSIDKIADDRLMFGGLGGCGKAGQSPLPVSFGGPHLLMKDILIGGKQ